MLKDTLVELADVYNNYCFAIKLFPTTFGNTGSDLQLVTRANDVISLTKWFSILNYTLLILFDRLVSVFVFILCCVFQCVQFSLLFGGLFHTSSLLRCISFR